MWPRREEQGGMFRGSGSSWVAAIPQLRKSLPRPFQAIGIAVTKELTTVWDVGILYLIISFVLHPKLFNKLLTSSNVY